MVGERNCFWNKTSQLFPLQFLRNTKLFIYLEALLVTHSKNLLGHLRFHGLCYAIDGKSRKILGIEEGQGLLGINRHGKPAGIR